MRSWGEGSGGGVRWTRWGGGAANSGYVPVGVTVAVSCIMASAVTADSARQRRYLFASTFERVEYSGARLRGDGT